jgi:hypothetical protein
MNVIYASILRSLKTPTAVEIAARELEEARRQLLRSQSGAEYATRISAYHQDRIKRLSAYLVDANKAADDSNTPT